MSWAVFLKIRHWGCLCNSMCVCVSSAPAWGDGAQNIFSAHTCTWRPDLKLCYRQNPSLASLSPCCHVLYIIPHFLVNTMQLSPGNWLQPAQMLHQVCCKFVDVTHCLWCYQSMMWLHFCGATGVAISFRLPLAAGKREFLPTTVDWCSRAVRCIYSAFMMLAFYHVNRFQANWIMLFHYIL